MPFLNLGHVQFHTAIISTSGQVSIKKGDTVTLVCQYTPQTLETNSVISLSWSNTWGVLARCTSYCTRGAQVDDRFKFEVDRISSGNFTIEDAKLADDRLYECSVTTNFGSDSVTVHLVVNGECHNVISYRSSFLFEFEFIFIFHISYNRKNIYKV